MPDCSKLSDIRYQRGSVNRSCEGELCKTKKENDKEVREKSERS